MQYPTEIILKLNLLCEGKGKGIYCYLITVKTPNLTLSRFISEERQ